MYQRDPSVLSKLYLPGAAGVAGGPGAQVPLSAVATLTRTTAPLAISHLAQFPAITLSFNLAPGEALGDAVEAVKAIEKSIGMSVRTGFSEADTKGDDVSQSQTPVRAIPVSPVTTGGFLCLAN